MTKSLLCNFAETFRVIPGLFSAEEELGSDFVETLSTAVSYCIV